MAVNRVPVLKRCRSLGMDPVYLGIDKKSNRQLKRTNRKMSEYGLQLREKQKAKFIYGVLEKQFRGYYAQAEKIAKKEGIPGENLLMLLEMRLDNVMFRLGYGRTRKEARQIVRHKHVTVNGKPVDIPSYQVKAGDVIEVAENSRSSEVFKRLTGQDAPIFLLPAWLEREKNALKGTVTRLPAREDIDIPVEEHLIVELYSK